MSAVRADGVALTVHTLPDPVLPDQARTRRGRWKMIAVLLVCAAPVVASYFTFYVVRPEGRAYSELISPPRPLPVAAELPLADVSGNAVDPATLAGQWLLVVVAEAACDAQCESLLVLQRQLRETLGKERDRVDKVWLVSDDAPVRPQVATATNAGTPVTTLRVPREAIARWLAPAPGHTLGEHLYVVDPMGNWMMRVPANPDPPRLKRDIERLLRASASWDQPGR